MSTPCREMVAIGGRSLDRALGLTLQFTLGCYKAMNLDGGSSKRMVIWDPKSTKHEVVCFSTTKIKQQATVKAAMMRVWKLLQNHLDQYIRGFFPTIVSRPKLSTVVTCCSCKYEAFSFELK